MNRVPVNSSNVKSIGYDPERGVMEVEFYHGGVYQYSGIAPSDHEGVMFADSKGKALAPFKGKGVKVA